MPYTPVRDIELIDTGSLGKEVLSNDAFTNLSYGISGAATIPLSSTDHTLTTTNDGESMRFVLILVGALTANVNLIVPAESRVYVVDNRTTGAFTVTCRPAAGGGVAVDQSARTLIYCDGSNVYPVASGTGGGGGAGAPTDASYLVGASHTLLSGERVVTNTPTITWDLATAGQAKAAIPADAVSYAHIQNVTPTRLLGRYTAGAGDVQEITPGTGLTLDASGVLSATAVGQPLDATLTALAAVPTAADTMEYFTGVDVAASTPLTPLARTLLDDPTQAAMQGTLALVPGTHVQPADATLTAIAGVTTGADTLQFFTGVDTASTTPFSPLARALLDDTTQAAMQATIGVTGGGGYTDEQAQDAVGAMLLATATIALAYADATPALTAAVVAGSIGTTQLTDDGVTYAKIQPVTDNRLLGRSAGSAGDVQEITPGTGLTLSGGVLSASGGGTTILNGAGPPSAVTGTAGDYYADTAAGILYGPKTAVGYGPDQRITVSGSPNSVGNYETGVRVQFARAGRITRVRYTRTAAASATLTVRVWNDDAANVLLTEIADTQAGATGSFTVTLPVPVAVTAGAIRTFSVGAAAAPYSGTLRTVTNTTDCTFLGFRYRSGAGAYPNTPDTASGYYAEPIFEVAEDWPQSVLQIPAFTPTAPGMVLASGGGTTTFLRADGTWATPAGAGGQPLDATLTALAGLATVADRVPYFTGVDTAALATFTAAGRTLAGAADAAAQRAALALGTMAQQDAASVAITGGTASLSTVTTTNNITISGPGNFHKAEATGNDQIGLYSTLNAAGGTNRWLLYGQGTAPSFLNGNLTLPKYMALGSSTFYNAELSLTYDKASIVGIWLQQAVTDTGSGSPIVFINVAGTLIGSISTNASTTSYNTSSDVRLKHAITTITGALDVVAALRPVTFRWNVNDSADEGFLAHELQQVLPRAVSGEPDAVHEDGSIKPQQVDHSKIVPWLTAALQETLAQVQALTARVASLEQQLGI